MADRLTDPVFEPIYALDEAIDTVEGYDYLKVEIHALSSRYPDSDCFYAVRRVAELALSSSRSEAVDHVTDTRRAIRAQGVVGKLNNNSDVAQAEENLAEAQRRAASREGHEDRSSLLSDSRLAGVSEEDRETIRAILEKQDGGKQAAAQREVEAADALLNKKRQLTGAAKRLALRKTPDSFVTIKYHAEHVEGTATDEDLTPSQIEFIRLSGLLSASHTISENRLVEQLYPELYRSNRPEAYRRFDETFDAFDELSQEFSSFYGFVQRGFLHLADQAGRPTRSRQDTLYRKVWNDSELINSDNGVQQRIDVKGVPHVIVWQRVTPNNGTKLRKRPK